MDIISSAEQIGTPKDELATKQLRITDKAFDLQCKADIAIDRAEAIQSLPVHPMDIAGGLGYIMTSGVKLGARLYAGWLKTRADELLDDPIIHRTDF